MLLQKMEVILNTVAEEEDGEDRGAVVVEEGRGAEVEEEATSLHL